MIVIVHHNNRVVKVLHDAQVIDGYLDQPLTETFIDLASAYPDFLILWCHQSCEAHINYEGLTEVFHHQRILASFYIGSHYLPEQIGYVERSYYLKINKQVTYPTWLMSSMVGGVHASVVNTVSSILLKTSPFDYYLNSLAKHGMTQGLFCYSSPDLLKENVSISYQPETASMSTLYQFIKQHYKWVWVYFLTLALCIYEKRLPIAAFLKSLFYKQQHFDFELEQLNIDSLKQVNTTSTVDVIIPTIGRKQYLYEVLVDLSKQTLLPKHVVIVEQNPDPNATSELDYLTTQDWPFNIKHTFTHQTGVCNARNIALSQVESEWTLLGDDDNRLEADVIASLLEAVTRYGVTVGTTVYLQPHETQTYLNTAQTSIFGAGNSLIKSELIKQVQFDKRYEFNYGEDNDFGMQLRHLGEDVIYFADIKITHLKAPMGGYRTKVKQLWEDDLIQPKPSPTIYLLHGTYFTPKQLQGYQLLLGLKSYKRGHEKNPVKFVKQFKAKWQKSAEWSQKLTQSINA